MVTYKMNIRDFEVFGQRPLCNACGCELDPETDTHHDGYEGSPYAHGGRGSYGMGSHHFMFNSYCESCSSRPEPLRAILQYDHTYEWLECGHTHSTPHNRYGHIRPGERRRCSKCKSNAEPDFDVKEMLRLQRKAAFAAKLKKQRNCTVPIPYQYRSTKRNWERYKREDRASELKQALAAKAAYDLAQERHDWAYNSDDH